MLEHHTAWQAYQDCRRLLQEQLAVSPAPETEALATQIRRMKDDDSEGRASKKQHNLFTYWQRHSQTSHLPLQIGFTGKVAASPSS